MFHNWSKPVKWTGMIIGGVILAAGLAFLFGLIVMWLWNWIMPDVFGLKELTYWQAWGIVLLAHILFKAGGHKDSRNAGSHSGSKSRGRHWKKRFKERFKDEDWNCETDSDSPQDEQPKGEPSVNGPDDGESREC